MGWFDRVKSFLGFDDEEEKRRQQQQRGGLSAPQLNAPSQSAAPLQRPGQSQSNQATPPQVNGTTLQLLGMTPGSSPGTPELLKKVRKDATQSTDQAELDRLAKANFDQAKREREQGEGWFGRNILNKANINRDAEVIARSRATRDFQEKRGYLKDPDVITFGRKTSEIAEDNSRKTQAEGERLKKVAGVTDKIGQVAQYVPVTGSVINLGLAGAERLQKATGRTGAARDTANTRNRLEFGMSEEEFAALPDDQKAKLQNIRNISYGLAPLDFTGFGGLAKAEAAQVGKKAVIQLAKEGSVDAATRTALKKAGVQTAKDLAVPTAVGTGVALGGQQYLTGEMDPAEAVKAGLMVGGTSMLFPGRNLKKVADPDTPGAISTNPVRDLDETAARGEDIIAAQDRNQQMVDAQLESPRKAAQAPEPTNEPAFLRKAEAEAAAPARAAEAEARAVEAGVGPQPLDRPAFQHQQDIRAVIQQGTDELNEFVNTNPNASRAEIEAAKADIDTQVMNRVEELQAARRGETPAAVPPQAAAEPVPAPTSPAAVPETPLPPEVPEAPAAVAAAPEAERLALNAKAREQVLTTGEMARRDELNTASPQTPQVGIPEQAPAAPRTHDALVKSLGSVDELEGQYGTRDVIDIPELQENARRAIAEMDDAQVVEAFTAADPGTMITSPQGFTLARAALDRLGQMADNPAAVQQVANIMDAMDQYVSRSGQGLRIAQEAFDDMPLPMKVRYIVKKIDRANVETKGYQSLADDPAKAARVEANLKSYLEASQDISERIAAIEGQFNNIADAAREGTRTNTDVRGLRKTLQTEKRNLAATNGELVKYFQDLVPGRTKAQKALVDFPKRMMLSSFTGRINDLLTTSANIANLQATNLTQGLISSAINLVRPGKVTNTLKGLPKVFSGAAEGTRRTAARIGGTEFSENLERGLTSNEDLRSGLRKSRGPVGRTIQAATEFATEASQGVRDQRLYQLADQEAAKLGLKGDLRRQYADARSAVPSRQMLEAAEQLHMEMNNLNENPVSRALNRVAAGIEGNSAAGGFLKNQIVPFTSWLGGNIYNTITDKNVVASTIKFADSLRRGDPEATVRNLSKSINGAVQAYAMGYALTEAGILTNENAEGYNDAGAYFKVGDRYIPATFAGFFAPNIILGNAAYNGLNNEEGENPAVVIAQDAATNILKAMNLAGALGVETGLARGYEAFNRPGGGINDALATVAGNAAGQFIPSLTGDVNAVLNNQTSLNPTKEAADTKVVNPNSPSGEAKDIPKSELQKLKNRIPFLSQTLPRKKDKAADDMVDRITRGDRDTPGGAATKAKAKTDAEKEADRKARGVPDTSEATDTKWQNGEFDLAIEGYKYLRDKKDSEGKLSKSDRVEFDKKISRAEVMRDKKISYEDWEKYDKLDLTDWRKMGDPEADEYDPKTYEKMFAIDEALKAKKATENSDDPSQNKFYAKESKSGSGGRGGSKAANADLRRIQSNTISTPDRLANISLGELAPQKAGSAKMPTIQELRSSQLVKKRKISVSKA